MMGQPDESGWDTAPPPSRPDESGWGTTPQPPHHTLNPSEVPLTPSPASRPTFPCRFFLQGDCRKGSLCPFPHEQPEDQTGFGYDLWGFGTASEKATACKYFTKFGRCTKDDNCEFMHAAPLQESRWTVATENVPEVCLLDLLLLSEINTHFNSLNLPLLYLPTSSSNTSVPGALGILAP
jgi:hypothetical protein